MLNNVFKTQFKENVSFVERCPLFQVKHLVQSTHTWSKHLVQKLHFWQKNTFIWKLDTEDKAGQVFLIELKIEERSLWKLNF